ncbi:MAG: aminotransferase class III-fold pyridoxal phosphate-dependent enzyme, partial [Deinococcus sp.]|nr:aminotransferase class III-fold pyridoxal phosphate-dependent enzyme [Deinococcus sp.]
MPKQVARTKTQASGQKNGADITKDFVERSKKYLMPAANSLRLYTDPPLFERGEGAYLYDVNGREYLDFLGGIVSIATGHSNARIAAAVADQARKLQHTSTLLYHKPLLDLAEFMASIAPGRIQQLYPVNSGSEAVDGAVQLARVHTGQPWVIGLQMAYHGRTPGAQSLTAQAAWRNGLMPQPGYAFTPNGYCYRCPLRLKYPECDIACAKSLEDTIRNNTDGRIAAVIAEPIQGVAGFVTPPPEYFGILVKIARDHGGLFIADETQTGSGRTGKYWWGIQHWGVEPDI